MSLSKISRLAVVLFVVAVQGCSTAPTRVEQHQALFHSLDVDTQRTLLGGETKIGYNMEMTYIALGSPDEIRRKQTATGETVAWVYQHSSPAPVYGSAFHYQAVFHNGGYGHYGYDPFFYTYAPYNYVSRDYLRVEFAGGHVASIEAIEN